MPDRIRKLIGTVIIIILVVVYAWLATTVAVMTLAESGPIVHLAYFLFSGLLWILPAMLVIRWMVGRPKA